MNSAALLRLFASLCLLVLLALPGLGCRAKGSSDVPASSGGYAAPAEAMGTHADFSRTRSAGRSSRYEPAPAAPASEAYDGGGSYRGGSYEQAPAYDYDDSAVASAPVPQQHRPGLGTSYGEHHFSQVTTAPFVRGSSQPDVLLALWYNDETGIRQARSPARSPAPGTRSWT